jgi:chemotaxis protein histidine kinase CheA
LTDQYKAAFVEEARDLLAELESSLLQLDANRQDSDGTATEERRIQKGGSRAADLEMQLVSEEILRLVEASRQGRLDERGRTDQFHGVQRDMVRGINEMLDAILLPIGEGNRVLAQISAGKIDELIAHTYQGDHEKMKLAVSIRPSSNWRR